MGFIWKVECEESNEGETFKRVKSTWLLDQARTSDCCSMVMMLTVKTKMVAKRRVIGCRIAAYVHIMRKEKRSA